MSAPHLPSHRHVRLDVELRHVGDGLGAEGDVAAEPVAPHELRLTEVAEARQDEGVVDRHLVGVGVRVGVRARARARVRAGVRVGVCVCVT